MVGRSFIVRQARGWPKQAVAYLSPLCKTSSRFVDGRSRAGSGSAPRATGSTSCRRTRGRADSRTCEQRAKAL